MLCSLCKRYSTKSKYNKTTDWSASPCICLRKDSVHRHASSVQHSNAVQLEKVRVAAEREGRIPQDFEAEILLQKQAIKGAMQCLYWLVYSEIPHTTKYSSLVDAVQFMGCEHFKLLHRSENAKYKSERIIQEFVQVVSDQIKQKQLQQVSSSPFYSVMIDESTDVAILKEMVVYARYISDGDVKTTFLHISELFNGKADTIESSLLACLEENDLPLSKLVGLGTDGASVMTGRHNGVAARLKRRQPILTGIHCLCHRLALAVAQAGNEVPFIARKFKPTLSQLFYFYENSPVRMSGLKAIEELLDSIKLKLEQPADTRWLSHDNVCRTLIRILPSVITSLSREAEERGDVLALGLHKVVQQYKFIATLYMMTDLLPTVTRLSRALQASSIDLSNFTSLLGLLCNL